MNFENILKKDLQPTEVALGYNQLGNLVIDLREYPSLIITGETGSGKSILLDQIILELMHKMNSFELALMLLDTSGVELNYYEHTSYTLFSAINDLDKSVVLLSKVLREIEHRKDLLKRAKMPTISEYNAHHEEKIPFLLVAIDDDKFLLRTKDVDKMLSGIIEDIAGLDIALVLTTSDVHNKFFESDANVLASMLISFDYTNPLEAKNANLKGADKLPIGKFMARDKHGVREYTNYDFDDKIIAEMVSSERYPR